MKRAAAKDHARLTVSRHAARLFLERGVAETSGDDIAAAAGVSTRTIWRYFRTKESCVEPLFALSARHFNDILGRWPRNLPIEDVLHASLGPDKQPPEDIADGVLVAMLVARLPEEPALRAAWLMATHESEERLVGVIADRLDRSEADFEVRLCAATVAAAIRIIDETISLAALKHGQTFSTREINERLADAIREASTLPFCDPVVPRVWPEATKATKAAGR